MRACVCVCVFTNSPGDQTSIPGQVVQMTKKMVLDTFLLNIQHYMIQIKGKWSNQGKGEAFFPIHRFRSYWKGSLRVTFNYSRPTYVLYIYIYILKVLTVVLKHFRTRNFFQIQRLGNFKKKKKKGKMALRSSAEKNCWHFFVANTDKEMENSRLDISQSVFTQLCCNRCWLSKCVDLFGLTRVICENLCDRKCSNSFVFETKRKEKLKIMKAKENSDVKIKNVFLKLYIWHRKSLKNWKRIIEKQETNKKTKSKNE